MTERMFAKTPEEMEIEVARLRSHAKEYRELADKYALEAEEMQADLDKARDEEAARCWQTKLQRFKETGRL